MLHAGQIRTKDGQAGVRHTEVMTNVTTVMFTRKVNPLLIRILGQFNTLSVILSLLVIITIEEE